MESTAHHRFSKGRKEIEQELLRGRDRANQLLEVLIVQKSKNNNNNNGEEGLIFPFAVDLVHEVLRSFTNTLLLLNSNNNDVFVDEVNVPLISTRDFSSSSSCQNHDDMDMDIEACKSSFESSKARRGCHKRKSTIPTWEKDSQVLIIEDGHAWRKYGQKKTTNSRYHRNYYRCTYKHDQGCQAIKHVQRIQEDPPWYRTTYYGHHSCKSTFNQKLIMEPDSISGSSMLLSFDKSIPKSDHEPFSSSSPVFESRKEEHYTQQRP